MTIANPDQPAKRNRKTAMPEWITRKDDQGGSWTVQAGRPERGDAWTNITKREMRIPTGDDPISRVVRAHEMVHTKVSPKSTWTDGRYGATPDSITCAEEYRVNTLVRLAGFDTDVLADGSEQRTGELAGMNKAWNEAIRFLCAVADTKAAASFIKGVKKHDPDMATALNEVHKVLKKQMRRYVKNYGSKRMASTRPTDKWGTEPLHPEGFAYTVELARTLDKFLKVASEIDGDDLEGESMDADQVRARAKGQPTGKWAPLVELKLPKPRTVSGSLGRQRIATNIGTNPRRLERLLTDPDRRVFDRKMRANGGIVVVDQSSSMSLTEAQLWTIINSAPGCLVIGYSNVAKSNGEIPNIWILADRGKVVDSVPNRRGGNGVDAPALRFAAKRRINNEAFVWVCDGQVTDENDTPGLPDLLDECASLVLKHRIHQVGTAEEAAKALARVANGERLPVRAVGPVARSNVWRAKAVA